MTFTVTYDGNGATGGSVPVDATAYNSGDQVTVLGNTGNLSLAGGQFVYWNTAADGSGALRGPGAKFTITGNVTLFAQWLVTDGLPNGGRDHPLRVLLRPRAGQSRRPGAGPDQGGDGQGRG